MIATTNKGGEKHNTTQRPHGHTSNPAQHFIKRHEQVIMERHEFTMGPGGMEPGPGRCKDALVEWFMRTRLTEP